MAVTVDQPRVETTTYNIGALAGALSVLLGIVGVFVDRMWSFPPADATAARVAEFVDTHQATLLAASVLNVSAVVCWLVFAVAVWLRLRAVTDGDGLLSTCFIVGFVSFVTLLLVGFTGFFVLTYRTPATDPSLLYDLSFGMLATSGAPTALALGSYAAEVYRGAHMPRWTASLALIAAMAHIALLVSFFKSTGFFSLEGGVTIVIPATLFAWILGVSVVLRRAAGRRGDLARA